MDTLKFKTNIKCGGCIATVTPFLNDQKEISSWTVDTNSAEKLLTVQGACKCCHRCKYAGKSWFYCRRTIA